MDYYQNDLDVSDVGNYTVFGDVFGAWDWSHAQPDLQGFKLPMPNTAIDLAHTMKKFKEDLARFIREGGKL